jgi:sugar phosphate isomerase/epimerase
VQLALEPIRSHAWSLEATRRALQNAGVPILSGMFEPMGEDYSTLETIARTGGVRDDARWSENLERARACAEIARELGLSLVTFHAGFLPHDPFDPVRATMMERLRAIADVFAQRGVHVAFETGQENASTLLEALAELDRPSVGVNFDPANMILYAMGDPVDALSRLADRVVQVHIKDAVATHSPGAWGQEVPAGTGDVRWREFFCAMDDADLRVDLIIEREAGDDRVNDVRRAVDLLRSLGRIA